MRIQVNGRPRDVESSTLEALLRELGYEDQKVGTALNQEFVRDKDRNTTLLQEGDAVEIVTPRQGG
ncbi:sulfur carrier protein ThiS [Methylocystis parvus OBBP]|uniref:Sulfur carrier protein ThiS n=1 Tax=Methylocystis parvus TaxID=134 RepID=A0A6B8LWS8_9HYPH|nr:sulfur carrier protein ThiS [Methylocystis parvus]QGM96837.1 sulfur carrier protein ThiS [Methylocystis parvus]WBJ99284.1 sulfur carrier protein ThiS [Methylocystis parvus OBBP]